MVGKLLRSIRNTLDDLQGRTDAERASGHKTGGARQAHLPLIEPAANPRHFSGHVFICGLHRSGTTMLENHLLARYDVAALRAPVPENEGQHLQDVYPAAREHGGPGRFAHAPEMRLQAPPPQQVDSLRERLLACWTPWITSESETLLEKSPPNLTKIAWLRAVFPGARFVIMTRDPRAVAAATTKWSGTSIGDLIRHWDTAHRFALQDEGDDCIRLRYEDYCEDVEGRLARLAEFLRLSPRPQSFGIDERFGNVANSNQRYFDQIGPLELGEGAWRDFGYDD